MARTGRGAEEMDRKRRKQGMGKGKKKEKTAGRWEQAESGLKGVEETR